MVKSCFFGNDNNLVKIRIVREIFLSLSTKSIRGPEPFGLDNCTHDFWLSVNEFLSFFHWPSIPNMIQWVFPHGHSSTLAIIAPKYADFDHYWQLQKKRWLYHLKFHFGSLFSTFQKWHLEVHRTRFKGIRDKKLL